MTTNNKGDLQLAKAAANGDNAAWESLIAKHRKKMHHLCSRFVGAQDADDLVQDALLLLWRKIGQFRGDSQLSTWIYRLTVNCCLMHLRRKSFTMLSLDAPQELESGDMVRMDIADERDGLLTALDVRKAMELLNDKQRRMVELYFFDGLHHREVAEREGITKHGSTTEIGRAKDVMRKAVDPERAARYDFERQPAGLRRRKPN